MGLTWEEFRAMVIEEFSPINEVEKLESELWNLKMVDDKHAEYTDRFHELAKLVPHLVTPESKRITRYINGLHPDIRRTLRAIAPATIQTAILRAAFMTDDLVRDGMVKKSGEKSKELSEGRSKQYNGGKKGRTGNGSNKNDQVNGGYAGSSPKCEKCNFHHHHNMPCNVCTNCLRGGDTYKNCRAKTKATPITSVRPGACFECGSLDHYRNACPKLNRTQANDGGRQGPALLGKGGNQARGRAFALGVNKAPEDPNAEAGTYSK